MNSTKTPVQIVTVVFAVAMLAGYVVYSQRQQTRNVAPGSKGGVIAESKGVTAFNDGTNQPSLLTRELVASSSKSMAPLIEVQRPNPNGSRSTSAPAAMVAPGSKSEAPIFELRRLPAQPEASKVMPQAERPVPIDTRAERIRIVPRSALTNNLSSNRK